MFLVVVVVVVVVIVPATVVSIVFSISKIIFAFNTDDVEKIKCPSRFLGCSFACRNHCVMHESNERDDDGKGTTDRDWKRPHATNT